MKPLVPLAAKTGNGERSPEAVAARARTQKAHRHTMSSKIGSVCRRDHMLKAKGLARALGAGGFGPLGR